VTADGLNLFYAGSTDGETGDMYVSSRASISDPWGAPVILGTNVNSPFFEDHGSIAWDGSSIVFASDRLNPGSDSFRLYEAGVIPEPGTFVLASSGLVAAAFAARRRRRNASARR